MTTFKIAAAGASDVNEKTLKLAPARALAFVQGVTDPGIHALLSTLGWSEQRANEAWALFNELRVVNAKAPAAADDPAALAMTACETWQGAGLVCVRATLQMTHPEQATFMFGDIVPAKGVAAVLGVITILERRQALLGSPDRKSTRKADHDAVAVMESAGLTKPMLKDMQSWVDAVKAATAAEVKLGDATERRLDVLRKLHVWVSAWSEMARIVVTRRDQLIRLGIARRKSPKPKAGTPQPPVVVPPSPIPQPSPIAQPSPIPQPPPVAQPTAPIPQPAPVAQPAPLPAPIVVAPSPVTPPATPAAPTPQIAPLTHDEVPNSRAA